MKKIFLLVVCGLLCSCKSITYQDVNPQIAPNKELLPAMEISIDMDSDLESVRALSGLYIDYFLSLIKNARVSDIKYIFEKEIKQNIANFYGEKEGYIHLKVGFREHKASLFYPAISTLTFGVLNLFGFPAMKISEFLEVEVQIINNKNQVIKRYKEIVQNWNVVAVWWGYETQNEVLRKNAIDNIKEALEKIRVRIGKDAAEIKVKLAE